MKKNEVTSKAGGTLAARILAMDDYKLNVWIIADPQRARKAMRSLAARLLTQRPDNKAKQSWVRVKSRDLDMIVKGPVALLDPPKYGDEDNKVDFIPRSRQARKAMRGRL